MVVIVGHCGAGKLFGSVFPKRRVILAEHGAEINAENAAVILADGDAKVSDALGIIAGEDCAADFPRGIQLITCGISSKNTVSLTSRSENKITLALNRTLRTQNGFAEPMELPADFSEGFTEFDYMAAFAANLLLQ